MASQWSSECTVSEYRDLQANAMAVDRTGTYVLLAGRRQITISNLDGKPNEMQRKFPKQSNFDVVAVEWNPSSFNKELCVFAVHNNIEILQWTSSDLNTVNALKAHNRIISDLNWHRFDANVLATCSIDQYINIWDIRDIRQPTMSLSAITGANRVRWNRVSPHQLATAHDGDVKLWDQRKGNAPVQYIPAHLSKIHALDWSPLRENMLATSGHDGTVKFFDIHNPRRPEFILNTGAPVWRARFTPFGEGLVTVVVPQIRRGLNSVLLWNTINQTTPVHAFVGHTDVVLEFHWRPRHERGLDYQLITWSKDQSLRVWRIDPVLQKMCGHVLLDEISMDLIENKTKLGVENGDGIEKAIDVLDSQIPPIIRPLEEEFKKLNLNISNLELTKLDAEKRSCHAKAAFDDAIAVLHITFPAEYPFKTPPFFQFTDGTTIDNIQVLRITKILNNVAMQRVKKERTCLESCLRQLCVILEQIHQGNEQQRLATTKNPPTEQTDPSKDYPKNTFIDASLSSSFLDAYIPFPRTSGAKFCAVDRLVTFGRPSNPKKPNSKTQSDTPRELAALGLQSALPVAVRTENNMSLCTYYYQERISEETAVEMTSSTDNTRSSIIKTRRKNNIPITIRPKVLVYNTAKLFPFNRKLAEQYVLSGLAEPYLLCDKNADVCRQNGQYELAQMWTMAMYAALPLSSNTCYKTVIAGSILDTDEFRKQISLEDQIDWSNYPYGRKLIEYFIEYYAKNLDIQTAAMLACVFSRTSGVCKVTKNSQVEKENHFIPSAESVKMWNFPLRGKNPSTLTPTSKNPMSLSVTLLSSSNSSSSETSQNRSTSLNDLVLFCDVDEVWANDCYVLNEKKISYFDKYKLIYADMLYRWNLLHARAQVLKFIPTASDMHRRGIEFVTYCQKCRTQTRTVHCEKCGIVALNCVICHLSVRGVSNFCLVCGHGGHTKCVMEWFENYDVCPTGCGCECLLNASNLFT